MNHVLYVTYPDGHTEEIQERFSTVEEAIDYAQKLLVQVENTERYHYAHGDSKGRKPRGKSSFVVEKRENGRSEVVFNSRDY